MEDHQRNFIPPGVERNWFRYGYPNGAFNYAENGGVPPWLPGSEEELQGNYSSAGVLVLNETANKTLLGRHLIRFKGMDLIFWGPFAGGRETTDVSPLYTARRECLEELGWDFNHTDLGDPLILVKGFSRKQLSYGLIFPAVIPETAPINLPVGENAEIDAVEWFDSSQIMELLEDGYYSLWGEKYTWMLLREWLRAVQISSNMLGTERLQTFLRSFHSVVGMESHPMFTSLGTYYHEVKKLK